MNQILEQLGLANNPLINSIDSILLSPGFMLAVSAVILLFTALIQMRSRRFYNNQAQELKTLRRDIRAITAAAIGVGERVLEIERRQRRLADRQEEMDIYDPANQSYDQAIHMMKTGSDIQEMVDVCGISESEAELIQLMNRLDKAS